METVTLPQSDLRVTRVSLGGCPLGGHGWGKVSDDEAIAAVRRALDLGVNFFDTADVYGLGRSEELLAKALGPHRHRVIIASKFGVRHEAGGTTRDASPTWLQQAIEGSLRRLQIDCIPLYYLHWPDPRTPIVETFSALDRLRRAGKIRAIGVSNFSWSEIQQAASVTPISAVQAQFSLVDQTTAMPLLDALRLQDIPLITWGSLAQGLLSGKYDASTRFDADDRRSRYANFRPPKLPANLRVVRQLRREAAALGASPVQIAMRWILDTPGVACVLFGAKNPEQVSENAVAALQFRLPAEVYDRLRDVAQDAVACDQLAAA